MTHGDGGRAPIPGEVAQGYHAAASRIASVWSDIAVLGRAVLAGPERRALLAISAIILAILLGNLGGQIWLNIWNRGFWDALEKRDFAAFSQHILSFLLIVALLLTLVVAQTFLRERFKIALRSGLVDHLQNRWLKFPLPYRLGFEGRIGENPDQRIQDDTRNLADLSAELGIGALQSLLLFFTFIGVLWSISDAIQVPFGGEFVRIPGYMVWGALLYAGIGSSLTYFVGRPLVPLNAQRMAREADFRFALVRVNENAESIGAHRGEADERRGLDASFLHVRAAMLAVSNALARLTWVTSGYGWLALIVPIIVAAPAYFSAAITFGVLMQATDAFSQVQTALRWFVDQFPRIADWRAALHRVAIFEQVLAEMEARSGHSEEEGIRIIRAARDDILVKHLSIAMPDGALIIAGASFHLAAGERVLVAGPSGVGKSTLVRALAGLWAWGEGEAHIPLDLMVMPQRPYLPLGTLSNALSYPKSAQSFSNAAMAEALQRVGLDAYIPMLDEDLRWDKLLSLGDQQRLAFARLLLHKPSWVVMDEASAALDEAAQGVIFALFETDLARTGILNVAHRPGFEAVHTSILRLTPSPTGTLVHHSALTHVEETRTSPSQRSVLRFTREGGGKPPP